MADQLFSPAKNITPFSQNFSPAGAYGFPANSRIIREEPANINYQFQNQSINPTNQQFSLRQSQNNFNFAGSSFTRPPSFPLQGSINSGYITNSPAVVGQVSAGNNYLSRGSVNSNAPIPGYQSIVKQKLVPVTQYVPVYEVEQVPIQQSYVSAQAISPNETIIEQRVIWNEPEAFKERVYYEEVDQTVEKVGKVERYQEAVVASQPLQQTKIVREPLIETVQANQWQDNRASRYVAPPPLPPTAKAADSCCSPFLLGLLALLALGGLIAALLLGRNSSRGAEIPNSSATSVNGTPSNRVGAVLPTEPTQAIDVVNGTREVQNVTSVAGKFITVAPIVLQNPNGASSGTKNYIQPTVVNSPGSPSLTPKNHTTISKQPKKKYIDLVPVSPIPVSSVTPIHNKSVPSNQTTVKPTTNLNRNTVSPTPVSSIYAGSSSQAGNSLPLTAAPISNAPKNYYTNTTNVQRTGYAYPTNTTNSAGEPDTEETEEESNEGQTTG